MDKKRVAAIDIARALAIILVVFGHTFSSGSEKQLIYAFHMPLFFLISGLLLRQKDADFTLHDLGRLLIRRFTAYYVPYLIWGLIYSHWSPVNVVRVLYGSREALVQAQSLSSAWFLPVLFVAACLAEGLLWLLRRHYSVWAVIAGAAALFCIGFVLPHPQPYGFPLGADIAFAAAGFMLLGHLVGRVSGQLFSTTRRCVVLTAVSALAFALSWVLVPNVFPKGMYRVSMYMNSYGNPSIFLLHSLLGSAAVLCTAWLLDRLLPRQQMLSWIGCNTLGILVLHKIFVDLGQTAAARVGIHVESFPTVCGVVLFALLGASALTWMLMRVAPFLLGKYSK